MPALDCQESREFSNSRLVSRESRRSYNGFVMQRHKRLLRHIDSIDAILYRFRVRSFRFGSEGPSEANRDAARFSQNYYEEQLD